MPIPLPRIVAALAAVATTAALAVTVPVAAQAADAANVRITEWMYNPANSSGEFFEITNLGTGAVSLAGWSFDDDSRLPGTVALGSLGTLAAGQSAIVTESTDAVFRAEWGVAASVPVLAGNTTNLGRADEINVFDGAGALVDRLGYNDQGTGTAKGPRTQGVSGVPQTSVALGANDASQWQLSAVADAEKSWTSTKGDIGSPGVSRFGAGTPGGGTTEPTTPPTPALDCQPEAPEGTGALPGAALTPVVWPGSAEVITVADAACAWKTSTDPEGRDISGLAFDPTNANVLYAVKNKSWVFRLVKQNGLWVADAANGWGAGKEIFFPGSTDAGTNAPDTEGLTVGADGALYVTTERNNAANTIPLNSILRFDPTSSATQLVATDQWNLTAEFPELKATKTDANLGFEGVAFVPDTYLVANGFVDQSTGATYRPADYPTHGSGLYFAGLENDGKLYAYALNADHSFHRVAVVDTGMGHVMDVQFDADAQRIWALCDNTCGVASTVLKVSDAGAIVPEVSYARPAGLPVNNLEGFAIAPNSTCTDGTKEVVWADDGIYGSGAGSATEGHALYSGRIDCDLHLGAQGVPAPGAWSTTAVYGAGDKVTYNSAVFEALWYTSGETPGASNTGAWAEIATAADGTAIWTASRVFTAGDVVTYQGRTFRAQWWTRGQTPGVTGGPWSEVVSSPAGSVPAWSSATVYTGGEKVTYQGRMYQAQWWTTGQAPDPTAAWGPWKSVG